MWLNIKVFFRIAKVIIVAATTYNDPTFKNSSVYQIQMFYICGIVNNYIDSVFVSKNQDVRSIVVNKAKTFLLTKTSKFPLNIDS